MRFQPTRLLLWAACVTLQAAAPAAGEASDRPRIEGVSFAPRVAVEDTSLELHSLGVLRWYLLKPYVAGLYLGEEVGPDEVLEDVPKRLEIHYFYGIDGEKFGPAADAVLERNLEPSSLAALRPRLDRMAGLFRDVEPGDRYSLTYLPGRGTELALNGEPLGRIPGSDFAAAYFSIWLGERPLDASLRRDLLRGGASRGA